MPRVRHEILVAAGALLALAFIGITMYRWSFDVWGGIVIAPVLVVLMLPIIRRLLGSDLQHLVPILLGGFIVKLIGACLRYYVVFDAYGKNGDAETYFDFGSEIATKVRNGQSSFFTLLPLARDTEFVEHLSAIVLTFLGPSRLGGFFIFSTFAYMGTVAIVRAACMSIPRLASRRYAAMCALAPSMAFWPSSLGKEAWIIGCVGFLSLGVAKILTWDGRGSGWVLVIAATIGVGVVRPHLAAIFAGAITIAIAFGVVFPPFEMSVRRRSSLLMFTVFAAGGLMLTATAATRYLDDSGTQQGVFSSLGSILDRTTNQTLQGGSAFETINIDSPTRWPFAVVRTLTRPLPNEVHNIATLLPSIETTLYLALVIICWRRTTNYFAVMRRSPYLVYVSVAAMLFGLAFSAIGNLGILVRQRSIVVPFVLVLLCLPQRGTDLDEPEFEKYAVYA